MSEERARRRAAKPRTTKTRSKRCGGCPSRGNSAERSCKVHRVCDEYDLTLRDHRPGLPHTEYVRLHALIAAGASIARATLPLETELLSADPKGFITFVRQTHSITFREAHPDWAGRFRARGERVYVGHNDHEFEGANAEQIEDQLAELWGGLCKRVPRAAGEGSEERFAAWAALFLERFLAIHPFVDGNGRTGRFVVEVTAQHAGYLFAEPYASMDSKDARKDRREYLYAIQYAHKYCGVTPAAHLLGVSDRSDPHRYLARWWAKRLLDLSFLDEEDRPAWIDADD